MHCGYCCGCVLEHFHQARRKEKKATADMKRRYKSPDVHFTENDLVNMHTNLVRDSFGGSFRPRVEIDVRIRPCAFHRQCSWQRSSYSTFFEHFYVRNADRSRLSCQPWLVRARCMSCASNTPETEYPLIHVCIIVKHVFFLGNTCFDHVYRDGTCNRCCVSNLFSCARRLSNC